MHHETEAAGGEGGGGGGSSEDAAAAPAPDHSSFSLFGMLARWNKEGEDMLRMQEFQEQVRHCALVQCD